MEQGKEFFVGQRFESYRAWDDIFTKYKERNKLVFIKYDGHKLDKIDSLDKTIVNTFIYSNIIFACKFGRGRLSKATKNQTR